MFLGKTWSVVGVATAMTIGLVAVRWLVAASIAGSAPLSSVDPQSLTGPPQSGALWPVVVSNPEGPPRVLTGSVDSLGRPVSVSCASCHANLEPNHTRRSADEPPMQFHQGLTYSHGGLSCLSCHNPQNYNTLRLADGAAVAYMDVMQMCAQCHSKQARDWTHGAHGGMTGYWDRTRGPRFRKSCIDCHDPHSPAFPAMVPTFKPRDRFLEPPHRATGDRHE